MENLLSRIGKTTIRVSARILAAVCTGILSVIETTGRKGKKGGR